MQSGYIRDPHSPQDWLYGALRPPRTDLPGRLNHESLLGPALDQGMTFECVAYAVAGLKRYHEWKNSRKWLDFDPAPLYAECKRTDGYPAVNGTLPRAAMDVLRTVGMIGSDGQAYKIASYARQNSVEGIKQALVDEGPVVLGIRLDIAAMNTLSNAELDAAQLAHVSGHCMLVVGYDDALNAFRVRNSWGETWGDCGHLWLAYDYLRSVDPDFDAWSTIDEVGG